MYSSKTIRSIFTGGMVENCACSIHISHKLEYIGDPCRCTGATGTDCQTFSVATGEYVSVGQQDMRTRLYFEQSFPETLLTLYSLRVAYRFYSV